jgi:hypothetical protein
MLYFCNDFICANKANVVIQTSELYNYNDNGFRCNSINSINTDNYILFAGCSHTEGLGLELYNSYPYITSQLLSSDYYNLGISGAGCDVVSYNLLTWLNKFNHKPKLIIVQWPYHLRYICKSNDILHCQGSWSTDIYSEFLILGDRIGYFDMRMLLAANLLKNIKIPQIHISFPEYHQQFNDTIDFITLDKANDNLHLGPKSHNLMAQKIADKWITMR